MSLRRILSLSNDIGRVSRLELILVVGDNFYDPPSLRKIGEVIEVPRARVDLVQVVYKAAAHSHVLSLVHDIDEDDEAVLREEGLGLRGLGQRVAPAVTRKVPGAHECRGVVRMAGMQPPLRRDPSNSGHAACYM